jgi:hypothetical protein
VTRRERDIVLLLGSILDAPFAQMHNWTAELVRKNAIRGEVPAHRVPCPACNGDKQRRVRGVPRPCDRCLGAQGRPLGYIVVDGMIDERYRRKIGTLETGVQLQHKVVVCDGCGGRELGNGRVCRYCRGSGIQEVELTRWRATRASFELELRSPAGDAVLASMEARERAGSYDELYAALMEIKRHQPAVFRLVRDVYIRGDEVSASERRAAERIGLKALSILMPDEIRVPAGVRRREREVAA